MADRSCTIYFMNTTRFDLTLQNHRCNKGDWHPRPPGNIPAHRDPNTPIPFYKWAIEADFDPFGGTAGDVAYTIEDRIDGVTFDFKDVSGNMTTRRGPNGLIAMHFNSPLSGKPECKHWFVRQPPAIGPVENEFIDPNPYYSATVVLHGQSDQAEIMKDIASEIVTLGDWRSLGRAIVNIFDSDSQHMNPDHPLYYVILKEKGGINDYRATPSILAGTVDLPELPPLRIAPLVHSPLHNWTGNWFHLSDNTRDVTLKITRSPDAATDSSELLVELQDTHRSPETHSMRLPVTVEIMVEYAGDLRRQPSPIMGIHPTEPIEIGIPHNVHIAPILTPTDPSTHSGEWNLNPVDTIDILHPSDLSITLVDHDSPANIGNGAFMDTLRISASRSLHLYKLTDVHDKKNIRMYAIRYIEKDNAGIMTDIMLGQQPKIQ
jgi:hypothetical protein